MKNQQKRVTNKSTSPKKLKNNEVEGTTTYENSDRESVTPLASVLNSSNQSGFDNEFLIRRKKNC